MRHENLEGSNEFPECMSQANADREEVVWAQTASELEKNSLNALLNKISSVNRLKCIFNLFQSSLNHFQKEKEKPFFKPMTRTHKNSIIVWRHSLKTASNRLLHSKSCWCLYRWLILCSARMQLHYALYGDQKLHQRQPMRANYRGRHLKGDHYK